MSISDKLIDQAYSDLKAICGGVRNDYLGLVYIEKEYGLDRDHAIPQIAFGGNDYGIDGFHFDREKRNLYLFQFKNSESHALFKDSFVRLIESGMERIFGAANQDPQQNQILQQMKSCILENEAVIERVCIHFVFMGDAGEAERSQALDKLREDLENKKYLIDQRFGRPVTLVIEFRSARTRRVSGGGTRKTHAYSLQLSQPVVQAGPAGETMTVGFVRLLDLREMYRGMGQRFFERNIRAALPDDEAVNRSIALSLKRIVLEEKEPPEVFAFNHNGVTLSAEALQQLDGHYRITEPRLLNGAQTVNTLARFLKGNEGNKTLEEQWGCLERLKVMCRVITGAAPEFVTAVTINNNRQNPVEPWNLRANDMIQLELQDKFREELGIYYQRQENAFVNLSDDELEGQGITEYRAIELPRLAKTFLVSDGDIDKLTRFREVFEDDRIYRQVFGQGRLRADGRKMVLCYKAQSRLRRLVMDIVGRGANKYSYIDRARNLLWALLCQGMLNWDDLESRAEEFGRGLSIEAQFTEALSVLATTRIRFIVADLVEEKVYAAKAAEGNYSFLRTNAAYKRCMDIAYKRYKWVEKGLK